MADRRRRVKQGLEAVLRRTAPPQPGASTLAPGPEAQPAGPAALSEAPAEPQAAPAPAAQPQEAARPQAAQPTARQRGATAPAEPRAGRYTPAPEPLTAPGAPQPQQGGAAAPTAARPEWEPEALAAETPTLTAPPQAEAVGPPGAAPGRAATRRGRPRSVTKLHPPEPKRHTSVYLYPAEFDMLDDLIYDLRRQHGVRIPKTELLRALLHLARDMLQDPERVEELLAACLKVMQE